MNTAVAQDAKMEGVGSVLNISEEGLWKKRSN
jgi:hypothetical protein